MIFGHLPTEAACSPVSAEASLILGAEHAGIMRGGRAVEQVELRFDSQSWPLICLANDLRFDSFFSHKLEIMTEEKYIRETDTASERPLLLKPES